jgi:phospholipid transport system substrate-binding protein
MHLRRRLLPVLGLVALLAVVAPTRPAPAADDAAGFIAQTADSVLQLARDKSLSQDEFKRRLRSIALQDFDAPRIAQFVLGRYWRTATDTERQQFVQAFEDYMVQVYATRFRQYGGAQFKVTGQHTDGNTSMVMTEIDRSSGEQPAKMIWQVNKGANGYKITDVSIEGISQAVTYRQEFSSVIEQHAGQVSALTEQLRQKANG